jgi:hypothetical protein
MRVLGGLLMGLLVLTAGVAAATPEASGRWKLGGDGGCYFDATDDGPDQCAPAPGRWKLGGDGICYFDATDGGPDQCAPVSSAPTQIEPDDSRVLLGVSDVRVSTDRPGQPAAELRQRPALALAA